MKHVTPSDAASAKLRTPTRRALAKQHTRAKVLAAARQLFSEPGSAGAPIRDIAAAAGMSTGAVFANFVDKSDLFREIMMSDLAALTEEMLNAGEQGSGIDDVLLRMFEAGYGFYRSQLPLARAAFSVSWAPDGGGFLRGAEPVKTILEAIAGHLEAGTARGELAKDPDLALRARMLFDAYLANYPNAIFDGWTSEALRERSQGQIRVILAGARPG